MDLTFENDSMFNFAGPVCTEPLTVLTTVQVLPPYELRTHRHHSPLHNNSSPNSSERTMSIGQSELTMSNGMNAESDDRKCVINTYNIKCKLCNTALTSDSQYKLHVRKEHTMHSCATCGQVYPTRSELINHRKDMGHRQATSRIAKPTPTPVPRARKFSQHIYEENQKKLPLKKRKHVTTPSSSNPKQKRSANPNRQYQCGMCDRMCFTRASLQDHLMTHTGEHPYKCDICNRYFKYMKSLSVHRATHTDAGDGNYTCSYCQRPFKYFEGLRIHQRTHTGERPYPCAHCDKSYTTFSNRSRHENKCKMKMENKTQ